MFRYIHIYERYYGSEGVLIFSGSAMLERLLLSLISKRCISLLFYIVVYFKIREIGKIRFKGVI
jgi:hypothetical protein